MEIPMRKRMAVSAAAISAFAWFGTLQAHHGTGYFFDTTKSITLEGEILRVEWVNPHRRLHIKSTNEKGESETWLLWGSANLSGPSAAELKERLQPGISVVARAFPSRHSGVLEAGAGEIRLPNGDVEKFGQGPTF
jgi:hypothetical protein